MAKRAEGVIEPEELILLVRIPALRQFVGGRGLMATQAPVVGGTDGQPQGDDGFTHGRVAEQQHEAVVA
ncbi:hypothetical protein HUT08_36190 [Streptomyces buecherae]|uniref:Uncharacterized protein n=1 Tax=Streptomyces buecherae TaxID=2763006 RepID=A0A7H8NKX4_9ACTN|nr:hypothetical protein [Streptomyces buecherae]QKW48232.1 hypothetical protein HUT08_00235 [Streptomyces buecherae]QKW54098.1 hypothetical protein HUT08_36190 [Streptomyces buecherae]